MQSHHAKAWFHYTNSLNSHIQEKNKTRFGYDPTLRWIYTKNEYLPFCTHGRMAIMDTITLNIRVELMKNLLREQLCNCMCVCVRVCSNNTYTHMAVYNTLYGTLYNESKTKWYRIAGNFCTVQTFAVFADEPTTAKIKSAKIFNSPVGYCTMQGFVAKIRTVKISSEASIVAFSQKFAPAKVSCYTVHELNVHVHCTDARWHT